MKKRRKEGLSVVLAALMAVFTMIGMVGCGAEGDSGSTGNLSASYESAGSSATTEDEWTEEETIVEDGSDMEEVEEEGDEFFETKEDEEDEENINHGIVACVYRQNYPYEDYIVFLVDPESGDYAELNYFHYKPYTDIAHIGSAHTINYGNRRSDFSHDVSRMAVSYTLKSIDREHAGWIDNTGEFFDVIEAAGMDAENEFADRPNYCSIGFTRDDFFVFMELDSKYSVNGNNLRKYGKAYYVALDDPTVVHEGNPLLEEAYRGYGIDSQITGWLNDDEYLYGDFNDSNFAIRSASGKHEDIELVPGDLRKNYDAVACPDGSTIAFLSSPRKDDATATMYTVSSDGSDIQKIFDCHVFTAPGGRFASTKAIYSYTLWWE